MTLKKLFPGDGGLAGELNGVENELFIFQRSFNYFDIKVVDGSPSARVGVEGTDEGVKGGGVDSILGNKDLWLGVKITEDSS